MQYILRFVLTELWVYHMGYIQKVHQHHFFKNTFIFDRLEVELVPFTYCSLACDFCETRYHRTKPNEQWFENALTTIKQKLDQTSNVSIIAANIWGGELFDDKIFNDRLFNLYKHFENEFHNLAKAYNCQYEFLIYSNCIHHNCDNLIDWIKQADLRFGTSFDFVGRFKNNVQLKLWWDNMQKIINAGIRPDLDIVAHKKNIMAILNKQGSTYEMFEQIYNSEQYNIDFEYYHDVNQLDEYQVTDVQIGKFLKYAVEHFPNVSEVYNLIKTQRGQTKNMFAEGLPRYYLKVWPNSIEWNTINDIDRFRTLIHNKQCIECVYKNRCSPRYSLEFDNTQYCINKDLFGYIDESKKN